MIIEFVNNEQFNGSLDVWAEDSGKPLLSIDLNECENVYQSESAKHYGIEIRVCYLLFLVRLSF